MKEFNNLSINAIFIGSVDDEHYFLSLDEGSIRGWSFMGLRSATEKELRERTRDVAPDDFYNIKDIERYFNYDLFYEDQEYNWYENFDVQAEYTENGETTYLGFGSGTDIFHYFKKQNISSYKDYLKHFDDYGLDEKQFYYIMLFIKERENLESVSLSETQIKEEKELFIKGWRTLNELEKPKRKRVSELISFLEKVENKEKELELELIFDNEVEHLPILNYSETNETILLHTNETN